MEKVSVIIPTYNRALALERAVKSVLNQTYAVHEVLICDDGSNDDSKDRIKAIGDARVKWIDCGRNGRPALPRNKGIKLSSGDWLAFLDDDDEWLPTKIEKQLQHAALYSTKAVCSNALKSTNGVIQKDWYSLNTKNLITLADLLKSNYIICSSTMVRKEVIQIAEGFPNEENLKALEDYALWLRISTLSDFAFVNDALLIYTDAPQQSIRGMGHDSQQQRKIIFKNLLHWVNRSKKVSKEHKNLIVKELRITRRTIFESFVRRQLRRFK